jgi:uncharacterized protein YcbX
MGGEQMRHAAVDFSGVAGDRVLQVYNPQGRVVTARRFPRLLRHRATLAADLDVLVDGLPWRSQAVAERVESAVGPGARLQRFEGPERFDVLPLLVCTDGAVAQFGRDVRRLRPNLLIEGVAGAAERDWAAAVLRIGTVLIGISGLRGRCVMTTVDPDTGQVDPEVLRDIVRRFEGKLCLNAHVIRPGEIAEGDTVELDRVA